MARDLIGSRIKALRQERGLSQDDVARLLGFNDRQTVSTIETGTRKVTAQELLLAAEKLEAPLEYFTDPFRLEGEGRFSWRQTGVPPERLSEYESRASRWIGAYRTLAAQVGRKTRLVRPSLGLTRRSRYEDAIEAGERFAIEFGLGEVPARRLARAMEEELGILVLMVDADEGISGAACRLPELDAVLIARREIVGRRHFDLAHELFHVLTWEAMPPKTCGGGRRDGRRPRRAACQQLRGGVADAVDGDGPVWSLGRIGPGRAGHSAEQRGVEARRHVIGAEMATRDLGRATGREGTRYPGIVAEEQRRYGGGVDIADSVLEAFCRGPWNGAPARLGVRAAGGGTCSMQPSTSCRHFWPHMALSIEVAL